MIRWAEMFGLILVDLSDVDAADVPMGDSENDDDPGDG